MILNKLRVALAAIVLVLPAIVAVDSASAATAIEYGLIFALDYP